MRPPAPPHALAAAPHALRAGAARCPREPRAPTATAIALAAAALAVAATAVAAASVAVAAVIEGGRALLANFRQECSFRTRIFPRTSTVISCGAVPRSVNSRLATRGPRWPRRS